MHRLNISYKQFYVTLNEIWLFESDPNAPSTWSERGGKQWQLSIRGRRNWDVELGPCAVIRHLCSVAFVWETKRPQADNSRSLIDRQVSCSCLLYLPLQRSWKGVYWFHHVLLSVCLSVRPSVRPSVRLSVCGQNRVRSVFSIILIRSISYLHILSSNFKRCFACNVCFKIKKSKILANSLNL